MRFRDLAAAYERLGATTKRLEMRSILVTLIQSVDAQELPEVLYLSQGLLRPEYEDVELGMADSLARKAVAGAVAQPESTVAESLRGTGDLGTTVEKLLPTQRVDAGEPLTVNEVYRGLEAIAQASGSGSQEAKVKILVGLLGRAEPVEAKYVVRLVLGRLRLGVREMSILDALAQAYGGGTKEGREQIEAAFNVSSDLGLVAQGLQARGLEGLQEITLTVGRPVRPMLAEREASLEAVLKRMDGRTALEDKYDGLRLQAHIPEHGAVRLFSRRLDELSAQFPELVEELPKAIRVKPSIVEGECVPIDPATDEILPFQAVSRRRGRKYDLDRVSTEIPVALFLFDVLLDGGEPALTEDFPNRRERLVRLLKPTERVRLATQEVVTDVESATRFFDTAIASGCEGVMAKSVAPGSRYHPGGRGFWWIKYKREYTTGLADSIDGVVVGAFHGRGRRAGGFGALLLAVYDPKNDRYETFCKVGSGFDDELLQRLPKILQPFEVDQRPEGIVTEVEPDRWISPKVVMEVRGAELTLSPVHRAAFGAIRPGAGLALRFPRFTGRFRDDKGPTDATTSEELVHLYRTQVRQAKAESTDAEPS